MSETEFFWTIKIALCVFVFRFVLMAPGMIFRRYFNLLDNLVCRGFEWLAKPLGYCDKCMAGQIAFWSYFLIHPHYTAKTAAEHAFFICLTVFWAYQSPRILLHDDDIETD